MLNCAIYMLQLCENVRDNLPYHKVEGVRSRVEEAESTLLFSLLYRFMISPIGFYLQLSMLIFTFVISSEMRFLRGLSYKI